MLKSIAAKKYHHNSSLKRQPTNKHEWRLMNQINQVPDLINKRVANIELRRMFLEGQNARNNAGEKTRIEGILKEHRAYQLRDGRAMNLSRVQRQALEDRVQQIDRNPANRSYLMRNPVLRPIIGEQPRYLFT
jgi:hypothetical protein